MSTSGPAAMPAAGPCGDRGCRSPAAPKGDAAAGAEAQRQEDREIRAAVVSCRAYGVAEVRTGKLVLAKQADDILPIASITKVLTFVTITEHMRRARCGAATLLKKSIRVSATAAKVKKGTHASLRHGDQLTVRQLLLALMLPSGNDAAVALAEFFGRRMIAADVGRSSGGSRAGAGGGGAGSAAVATERFVREMNDVALRLGLSSTTVHDPHGMRSSRRNNTSTVADVARLVAHAQRDPVYVGVCSTRTHEAVVKNRGVKRRLRWRNTNDLLWLRPADGITCVSGKTGWIPNVQGQAVWGSLATVVARTADARTDGGSGDDTAPAAPAPGSSGLPGDRYIFVVIGCTSRKRRFIDSRAIARWSFGMSGAAIAVDADPDDGSAAVEGGGA